jgi:protein SCO1/2
MNDTNLRARRRAFCAAAFAATLLPSVTHARVQGVPVGYHGGPIIPPVPVPDWTVHTAQGQTIRFHTLLKGRVTALQLFFTGCSTTCPIQGVVFRQVQSLLGSHPRKDVQLLSLSVDPLSDTSLRMRAWLARFGAQPGWLAAAPELSDIDAVQALFADGANRLDNHSTQVQIIDRQGQLIWRTYELPSPETIAKILTHA